MRWKWLGQDRRWRLESLSHLWGDGDDEMSDDTGIVVVPLTTENRPYMAHLALSMYADEPCRICRKLLTMDDLRDGAVFAGYSVDGTARAAHRVCWENFVELLVTLPDERLHEIITESEPTP